MINGTYGRRTMKNEQSRRPMKLLYVLTMLLFSLSGCTDLPPTRSPVELYRPNARRTPSPTPSPFHPEVLDVSLENVIFEKISNSRGRWSGILSGQGDVELRLMFYSKGRLTSSTYMGATRVAGKGVPFVFETKSPRGNWNWKIALSTRKQNAARNNS